MQKKYLNIMSEIIPFKIQQIVDNGNAIQLSLIEDVQEFTEIIMMKSNAIMDAIKKQK